MESGGQQYLLGLESFYFCELGAHAKFWNPTKCFENTPLFSQNIYNSVRGRGVPPFFVVGWNPSFFLGRNPTTIFEFTPIVHPNVS
jgi:hypothetical protein